MMLSKVIVANMQRVQKDVGTDLCGVGPYTPQEMVPLPHSRARRDERKRPHIKNGAWK